MRAARGRSARRARCRWTRRGPLRLLRPPRPPRQEAPAPKRPSDMAALVHAHCPLGGAAFDPERAAGLARGRRAGVAHVVVIGATLEESDRAVSLARSRPGLSATA